mmetsp:Transcript_70080/g.150047  ORF Transcript_70080/g.150047 Transcript_70080/m.150047 type:complete len:233 (-) Transcript_70080:945-1643(-)
MEGLELAAGSTFANTTTSSTAGFASSMSSSARAGSSAAGATASTTAEAAGAAIARMVLGAAAVRRGKRTGFRSCTGPVAFSGAFSGFRRGEPGGVLDLRLVASRRRISVTSRAQVVSSMPTLALTAWRSFATSRSERHLVHCLFNASRASMLLSKPHLKRTFCCSWQINSARPIKRTLSTASSDVVSTFSARSCTWKSGALKATSCALRRAGTSLGVNELRSACSASRGFAP